MLRFPDKTQDAQLNVNFKYTMNNFFSFLASNGIWNFQVRDQIQAVVVTYAIAVVMLDH